MAINAPNIIEIPGVGYYDAEYVKTQIALHHTVSLNSNHRPGRSGFSGDAAHWISVKKSKGYNLGTCVILDADGSVGRTFSSRKWAFHLGLRDADFDAVGLVNSGRHLDKHSIGAELDILGPLKPDLRSPGKFMTAVPAYARSEWISHIRIDEANVTYYPDGWHGHKYWESYPPAMIESLRVLLLYWVDIYKISPKYNPDMWERSKRALSGENGIWTHVSYRGPGKSDCHPDPNLIAMLKNLEQDYLDATVPPVVTPPPAPAKIPLVYTKIGRDHLNSVNVNKANFRRYGFKK